MEEFEAKKKQAGKTLQKAEARKAEEVKIKGIEKVGKTEKEKVLTIDSKIKDSQLYNIGA